MEKRSISYIKDVDKVYRARMMRPLDIAAKIQHGWNVVTDNSMGAPKLINEALTARLETEPDFYVTVHTLLDVGDFPFYRQEQKKKVGVSWFSGNGARRAIARGRGDIMPNCYKDMPRIFRDSVEVDVFSLTVSPMDAHGYFSAGIIGSNTATLLAKTKHLYIEVNPYMPRVVSAPQVHISEVEGLCECNEPIPEAVDSPIDDISRKIGNIIGAVVPDGATIQLGIGAIPNAVGEALKSKHNLGIHTELLTDKMLELIECGAVTNMEKPIHRGKTVTTFAYGSRRLYDYMDDNPSVEVLPVDYVNEPEIIGKHPNFISVNSALQVDFWGQVSAESLGSYHVSGTGGQLDYVRGALKSPGGKSFIAFPSTAKDGTVSRIVPTLDTGAIVTTNKNEVDSIVTEYGIADLRGKTLSERTKALITIAHPKFREKLLKAAKEMHISL